MRRHEKALYSGDIFMDLKIFHTADVHLGLKFSRYDDLQSDLIAARFDTLQGLVEKSNEEACHLFAVAGDLFDRVTVAKRDIQKCVDILNAFEGHLVAVLPGNHDYVSSDSDLWAAFNDRAGDRVLVLDKRQSYDLTSYDLSVALYPGPCEAKHSGENAIGWITEEPKDTDLDFHIGIAHGNVAGYGQDDEQKYYPMTREELLGCDMDLWLLGHIHVQSPSEITSQERIYYSGIPEPDGFDCHHEGCAWLLELRDDRRVDARPIQTGTYRFAHHDAEIQRQDDIENLKARYSGTEYARTLLKLKLNGRVPQEIFEELPDLKDQIGNQVGFLSVDDDDVAIEITSEKIDREFTDGSFPHQLLSDLANNDADAEALQIAYEMIQEART